MAWSIVPTCEWGRETCSPGFTHLAGHLGLHVSGKVDCWPSSSDNPSKRNSLKQRNNPNNNEILNRTMHQVEVEDYLPEE